MISPAGPTRRAGVSLPQLTDHVARHYGLGRVDGWSVLTTGYEDRNIGLRASRARIVIKVFSPGRASIAPRTADLITRAQAAGVRHPQLHRDRAGSLVHPYRGLQILVMDFDPGRSLYDLRRAPSTRELAALLEQAVRIHAIDAHPAFVFDSWAITNLVPMAAKAAALLDARLRRVVVRAVEEISHIDRNALPQVLIHADLTKGNILIGPDGEPTVLDFAVANRFPRVQELAVIAANLTHGSPEPLPARIETIATMYSAGAPVPLTDAEHDALRAFGRAAAAMELLGALSEWQAGNRSAETEYLISLGTAGLSDYLTVT
jgi:Ser/Thr protein kinase RdoA (MazF antagonist)